MQTRTVTIKSQHLILLVCICLLSGAIIAWGFTPTLQRHFDPEPDVNVYIGYELFSGKSELQAGNLITNIGENQTCIRFHTNGTYVRLQWISIGNATAAASLTQLTTQHDRKGGTLSNIWTSSGDQSFNVTYKWTFASTVNLNCAGSHWAASGDNNMFACADFPSGAQTFTSGENLTVKWVFTFNCN